MKTSHNLSVISVLTLLTATSCLKPKDPFSADRFDSAKLSAVSVKVPDSSKFQPSQGSAKVTSYHIIVKPKDSTACPEGTAFEELKELSTGSINQKFVKGCDYVIKLALGEKDGSGNFVSYYENAELKSVSKVDLESSPVIISLQISITAAGKSAYMPQSLSPSVNPPVPTPPQPSNSPTPTPAPAPQGNATPLADSMKGSVKDGRGQSVSMESIFTTEFMIVDFSNPGCGYCESHAREFNRNTQRQALYSGSGKCKSITATSASMVGSWLRIVGASSFIGKNSYGHEQGMNSFSKMFGLNSVSGTPTFIFVDRQGKILKKSVGADPAFDRYVDQQCQ